MAENIADESEVVLEDELFFDDPPREPAPRRDELVREGEVLAGKYRVERIPGRNGLGVLVQVRHMELGQEVTLKFLVPDACIYPEFVQRFIREARAAVKIQGEHVARVTDVGRLESGAPYMVREFLRGPDLAEVVKVRGALPVSEACDYIIQAAEAVAEAHALGIAHRNLRPTTLVVTRRTDGAPLVKVFDFAAAEALHVEPFTKRSVSLVGSSALLGSLPYLSPEQVRDPHGVDFRADVYALGAVLYELLSGLPPFEAESAPALLAMVAADSPAPLRTLRPDLPEALEQIVMRCLAKSRDLRFSSIAELALALRLYASAESTSSIDRIVRLARRASRPPSLSDARISTSTIPVASPPPSFERAPLPAAAAPRPYAAPLPYAEPSSRTTQRFASYADDVPSRTEELEPLLLDRVVPASPSLSAESATPAIGREASRAPRAASVPPPLHAQSTQKLGPLPPPPHAPSSTKTTMMPPASGRGSISGGLSRSWAAPEPESTPLPVRKLAMIGLVASFGAFGVILALRGAGSAGQSAAAGQPVAAALVATQPAHPPVAPVATEPPAPAPEPAVSLAPAPSAQVAPAQPAPAQAAQPAAAQPAAAAPARAAVAPVAAPMVAAAPPAQPRAVVAPAPRPAAKPRPAEPIAEEAPHAAAKVATGVSPKAKDLFSDPD
jgi:serine/threonine-protein kinase